MSTDSSKVNSYQDNVCKAIETISNNLLKKVSYDKTIVATIIDITDKKEGKYQCSNGTNTFTAYSTKTDYEKGNSVYITIPNGNWENQKIIIGKKTGEEIESPFLYTTPLMSILDMTGNLVKDPMETEYSLAANDLLVDEVEIYSDENDEYDKTAKEWKSNDTLIPSEMTRLVLSADFKTLLSGAIKGTYGIKIRIIGVPADNANVEKEEEKYKDESYEFTNDQMFGNTYNFASYYNQQMGLDISGFNQIKSIQVSFFQNGDFSTDAEKLVWRDELFKDIFCKNVYLCAGKEVELFDTDQLNIWTDDGITYRKEYTDAKNTKNIKMSWVHVENKVAKIMKSGVSSKGYYIRWYKYSVGAQAADAYCGTNWMLVKEEDEKFENNEIGKYYDLSKEANWEEYKFVPDTERQQNIIKAIIFKKVDNTAICICRSNELTLENDEIVPSQETIDKDSALTVVVDDESEGDYYLYGQDKRIYEETDRQRIRTLGCKFKENASFKEENIYEPSDEFVYTSIKWKFLYKNSMLELVNESSERGYENEDGSEHKDGDNKVIKYYTITSTKEKPIKPQYKINRNLIKEKESVIVEFERYNRTYTALKNFNFGKRGTMGTDTTLIVNMRAEIEADGEKQSAQDAHGIWLNGSDNNDYWLTFKAIKNGVDQWLDNTAEECLEYPTVTEENGHAGLIDESFDSSIIKKLNTKKFKKNELYIFKVTAGKLSTYYAVPTFSSFADDKGNTIIPNYLTGPTSIIYDSAGLPDYKKEAYELYDINNNIIDGLTWSIYSPAAENDKYIGEIQNNKYLIPYPFYLKDAPIYGVQAKKGDQVIWTQPILVLQNRWSSGVINKWDGKSIKINEDKNYILSPAIAAGKKNNDNSFSGVMIGDWANKDTDDTIAGQTGIYGFNKGVMSYALREDGTATIGREGNGCIKLDGNEATIYSSGYSELNSSTSHGMRISLGYINDEKKEVLPYLLMKKSGTNLKKKEDYPFQIGENFRVNWSGSIYANDGEFTGTLYATGGEIRGDLRITSGGVLSVEAAKKTEKILIKAISGETDLGGFGIIKGNSDNNSTYNLGIKTNNNSASIVLESSRDIRLSSNGETYIEKAPQFKVLNYKKYEITGYSEETGKPIYEWNNYNVYGQYMTLAKILNEINGNVQFYFTGENFN